MFDQGGLIVFNPDEDTTTWIKMGIEVLGGKPPVMSVATSQWSDAAIKPLGKEKDVDDPVGETDEGRQEAGQFIDLYC